MGKAHSFPLRGEISKDKVEATRGEEQDIVQRKKKDQGYHECEVFGRGPLVTESATAWDKCTKNRGHSNFIPAPQFELHDLPKHCQYQPVLEVVKSVSERTVRLRVGYTSLERPDNYTFSNYRGTDVLHTGSGWVYDVKLAKGPCPCAECALNPTSPARKWYAVSVQTACHVVYNSEEARATRVDFFYDYEQSRMDGRMRTLWGYIMVRSDRADDFCMFKCATHDDRLADQLKLSRWTTILNASLYDIKPLVRPNGICVVSHPHGQAKQITVGITLARRNNKQGKMTAYYNANTCPGSSGGPVLMFGSRNGVLTSWSAIHSLGGVKGGLNSSSSTRPIGSVLYFGPL